MLISLKECTKKLCMLRKLVEEFAQREYPQAGARVLAQHLIGDIDRLLKDLEKAYRDPPREEEIDSIRPLVDKAISEALDLLGVLRNCSDTHNPLEIYWPFLSIVRSLTDERHELIVSYEWNYVPFNRWQTSSLLSHFVIIGLPANEARNPLILPVVGHEVGHAAWRYWRTKGRIRCDLADGSDRETNGGTKLSAAAPTPEEVALEYFQEVFCDLVGLRLFGDSYIKTFNYFMRRPRGFRDPTYPSIKARAAAINKMRQRHPKANIAPNPVCPEEPQNDKWGTAYIEKIQAADRLLEERVDDLLEDAASIFDERGLGFPKHLKAQNTYNVFTQRRIPSIKSELTFGEIVSAAWLYYEKQIECQDSYFGGAEPAGQELLEQVEYLNNLTLKSIELIELRQSRVLEPPTNTKTPKQ